MISCSYFVIFSLKTLLSHSNLLCACSHCVLTLGYNAARTDFLRSNSSSSSRAQGTYARGSLLCSRIFCGSKLSTNRRPASIDQSDCPCLFMGAFAVLRGASHTGGHSFNRVYPLLTSGAVINVVSFIFLTTVGIKYHLINTQPSVIFIKIAILYYNSKKAF